MLIDRDIDALVAGDWELVRDDFDPDKFVGYDGSDPIRWRIAFVIPVLSGPVEWSRLLDDTTSWSRYETSSREFDAYMANGADHWFQRRHADELGGPIAYFCAEYGFHESLGIYSGGLGVLAGDHRRRRPTWPCRSSASGCSTARATSTRRSTPTATRSTPTPTTT